MLMVTNLFPTKPLAHRSAQWVRMSLRLLGLTAWLLLALLCLTVTGCRPTAPIPTSTPTVIPFATFTSTPVAIALATAQPVAAAPTPMPLPTTQTLTITLPAPLYYLGEDQQIWHCEPTGALAQLTQEAAGITAYDLALMHGRLVYVTNEYRNLVEFDPASNQRTEHNLAQRPEYGVPDWHDPA